MAIGTLDAAAAYGRSLKTLAPAIGESTAATEQHAGGGNSFGSMIETMVSDAAGSLRTAEAESAKQVAGKGDMIDVVTAIGAAETALDTVVAVRDRVVSAYSEIMRMQI
ncbi:flagellar hook-basal body complex protein FliE [Sphingobium lactosutens]|uniref:flagellar hook-basal body complex protein FliE n=1 Tax=Sphingobium lactosutens TaxID=522773 RepID=UPI0015B81507|nr:flagellar hook-basal body complex protein FliE [Sphingobium lactosutens]NWK98931.1 flagellar hook-basal body complex protein FliE [Sphingobium lactosutens]